MLMKLSILTIIILIGISTNYAFSQEMGLATFQETAQVIKELATIGVTTPSLAFPSSIKKTTNHVRN